MQFFNVDNAENPLNECASGVGRVERLGEAHKAWLKKKEEINDFYGDKIYFKRMEQENVPLPEPIIGKDIVKKRHRRCLENEEAVAGLIEADHILDSSEDLLDMVLQPGEEHVCTLKVIKIVNGPGPADSQTHNSEGEGYVSVTKTEKDDHRLHFWMLNKTSIFEASEQFKLESEVNGKPYPFSVKDETIDQIKEYKNTHVSTTVSAATNRYMSERIRNSAYTAVHPIEENLFHAHANMSISSKYVTKVEGYKKSESIFAALPPSVDPQVCYWIGCCGYSLTGFCPCTICCCPGKQPCKPGMYEYDRETDLQCGGCCLLACGGAFGALRTVCPCVCFDLYLGCNMCGIDCNSLTCHQCCSPVCCAETKEDIRPCCYGLKPCCYRISCCCSYCCQIVCCQSPCCRKKKSVLPPELRGCCGFKKPEAEAEEDLHNPPIEPLMRKWESKMLYVFNI